MVGINYGTATDPVGNMLLPVSAATLTFDSTRPAASAGLPLQAVTASPSNRTTLVFSVGFTEPVFGLAASKFVSTGSTCTGVVFSSLTGSGSGPYSVSASGMAASPGCIVLVGLRNLQVADAAGNPLMPVSTASLVYGSCCLVFWQFS